MGITFGRPPPKIWEGEKNVQNSAQFLTTFDFDREYLPNGSIHRKSEEYFINYSPFHVGWKKIGELWSTNKNVLVAHIDPPKRTFFGRLHFTRVTDWPILASAHHNWDGGSPSPQKILIIKFKILLKIQRISPHNFWASENILTKLFQTTWWTLVHILTHPSARTL